MDAPATQPTEQKKPWPMGWVAAAIIVFIAGYTYVNIAYRKEEAPHEPWSEAQERKNRRVAAAMGDWTRFRTEILAVDADFAVDEALTSVEMVTRRPTPAKLEDIVPVELALIVPIRPHLHAAPVSLGAPGTIAAESVLQLHLEFAEDNRETAFGEFMAFAKDNHLYLFLQDAETLPEGFAATPPAENLLATLPEASLEAGSWKATLYAAETTFDWEFEVR